MVEVGEGWGLICDVVVGDHWHELELVGGVGLSSCCDGMGLVKVGCGNLEREKGSKLLHGTKCEDGMDIVNQR